MRRQEIPVVWGIDKKYVLQAFVVMRSILQHSKERYHFFVLTSDPIRAEVEEFTQILKQEQSGFEVSVKMLDDACFKEAQIHNRHLSKAAYFRLLIPDILEEYDRCIYLDCDLIVHGNLKELYDTELGECYLAGVKDCHIIADTPYEEEHQRMLGLPARDRYINSGVIVMNLKKMRQDELVPQFFEQLKKENRYEDQDVLNVCCYPWIKILPLKYNLFHFYLGNNIRYLYDLPYDRQEFDFSHEYPDILHLGGAYKVWDGFPLKGGKEWWGLAELFSATGQYQFYRRKCEEEKQRDELSDIMNRARQSGRVVIWGYGENGKYLCDVMLEHSFHNIEAIIDNNEGLWGEAYHGIPIRGFAAVNKKDEVLWLISCRVAYTEVIKQLRDYGIEEERVIRFHNMAADSLFLLALEKNAYDHVTARMNAWRQKGKMDEADRYYGVSE